MADQDIEAYLRSLKTSDRVRAAAWDAIYTVPDDAQAQTMLQQLTLPDAAKAAIWAERMPATSRPCRICSVRVRSCVSLACSRDSLALFDAMRDW